MRLSHFLRAVLLLGILVPGVSAQDEPLTAGSGGVGVPKRTKTVAPEYPAEAQSQGIRGIVILELTIDRGGKVADARIIRSVPGLDEAALTAARQWTYEVTKVDGKPVSVRLTVPITFAMKLPEMARQEGIPELRQGVTPPFPQDAKGPATVVVQVSLDGDGRVAEAQVSQGEAPWTNSVMAALRTWRFAAEAADVSVSFRVQADFIPSENKSAPKVSLRLDGLRRSESLAGSATGAGASGSAAVAPAAAPPTGAPQAPGAPTAGPPPSAAPATAPQAPGAPTAGPPPSAPPATAPQAPGAPTAGPPPSAPPATAPQAPGAPTAGPPPSAPPATAPQAPGAPTTGSTPAAPPTTAPKAPGPPTAGPTAAAPPASAPPASAPPAASAPTSGTPPARPAAPTTPPASGPAQAPPPASPSARSAAPPVEVISAPPPPTAPVVPETGTSALRDVVLEEGVPDLTRGRRPVAPPFARMSATAGFVEVQFSVSAGGTCQVQSVSGPDILKPAAEQTVISWQFRRTQAQRLFLTALFRYDGDKASALVHPQTGPPAAQP